MQGKKRANLVWSVIAFIITFIVLIAGSTLLVFAFMGYENGDFPALGSHGIYAVSENNEIVPANSAVVTDRTLSLERGCPVVFVDEDIKGPNKMNILYLYDWDEEQDSFTLTDEAANTMHEVEGTNLRGRAVSSMPFAGWLLNGIVTVYGICILLLAVCLLIVAVILSVRGIVKNRRKEENECFDVVTQPDKTADDTEARYESSGFGYSDEYADESTTEKINDDISYEMTSQDDSDIVITFFGEAAAINKLGKLIKLAAIKKNANSISTEENYAEVSTLVVNAHRQDEELLLSIIKILKSRAE